ncbi:hypothetical protein Dimus_036873, partial [Dionaea muscipula]
MSPVDAVRCFSRELPPDMQRRCAPMVDGAWKGDNELAGCGARIEVAVHRCSGSSSLAARRLLKLLAGAVTMVEGAL